MFIYRIRNLINEKVYIGKSTTTPAIRWKAHKYTLRHNKHRNIHFQRAWNFYGEINFVFEVLKTYDNIESLNDAETVSIIEYRSCNSLFGYNMSFGGEGTFHTPEIRAKISAKAKGRISPLKGKKMSPESCRLISEKAKLRIYGPKSEETKLKMSLAAKGRIMSEQARANMRIAFADRPHRKHSEETKKKMSITKRRLDAERKTIESNNV